MNGPTSAALDVRAAQLARQMAEYAHDDAELTRITEQHLADVGPAAFTYVTSAALCTFAEHVLSPLLEISDALHAEGLLTHDVRQDLADARTNARNALAKQEAR